MPELSLRFAVRSDDGATTDVWKLWTNHGQGRRDVYMTNRPIGYALKLSLHEGGQWHVAFHGGQRDKLFDEDHQPASRFLGKWQSPNASVDPFVLAARVVFPWASPSTPPREAPNDTVWLPAAPKGSMNEVAVFLINVETPVDDWPGKSALSTSLVGNVPLEGGGRACAVHRFTPMPNSAPTQSGSPNYFRGKSREDILEANRMVAWGQETDGSIVFIESKLIVEPKSAA